ncbi:hypothetical protein V8E54_009650 [Elaphomyces granulatus]
MLKILIELKRGITVQEDVVPLRAVPDTADTPILPIFAVTISATISLPLRSPIRLLDDIGETGKEYEIKCQNKEAGGAWNWRLDRNK